MKKIAIAAAVASTLLSAAHAQTSVTLYGVVDLGYEHIKSGELKANRLSNGILSGSRWGLKGTEELGDGLKVNFRLESGFGADTGRHGQGDRLFGRQAWVSLQSDAMGELRLGRQTTPIGMVADNVAAMDTSTYSVLSVLTEHGDTYRMDNGFAYFSPNMGGFQVHLAYSPNHDGSEELTKNTRKAGQEFGIRLDYTNGPLYIGLGHNSVKTAYQLDAALPIDSDTNISKKSTLLGGSYDFGPVKLFASHTWDKESGIQYDSAIPGELDVNDKHKAFTLGALIPAGNGEFNIEAGRLKYKNVDEGTVKAYNVGYKYFMSKRTTAYFQYLHVSNGDAKGKPLNDVLGQDKDDHYENVNGLTVGLRHTF